MRKLITLFFVLVVVQMSVLEGVKAQNQEAKAQKIIEKTITQIKSYNTIKIIFDYVMTNEAEGINESFKGEILSQKEKYRLKVAGQEIYCNGAKRWTYMPDAEEVQLNNVSLDGEAEGALNPLQLLDNYAKKFKVTLQKSQAKHEAIVKLMPKEEEMFKKALITINTQKNEPISFSMYDEVGNIFTYKIVELIPNIALKGNEFTFDTKLHPDVEVIDMR